MSVGCGCDPARDPVCRQNPCAQAADVVLFVQGGRVVEAGGFQELMAKPGGVFAAMMKEVQVGHNHKLYWLSWLSFLLGLN